MIDTKPDILLMLSKRLICTLRDREKSGVLVRIGSKLRDEIKDEMNPYLTLWDNSVAIWQAVCNLNEYVNAWGFNTTEFASMLLDKNAVASRLKDLLSIEFDLDLYKEEIDELNEIIKREAYLLTNSPDLLAFRFDYTKGWSTDEYVTVSMAVIKWKILADELLVDDFVNPEKIWDSKRLEKRNDYLNNYFTFRIANSNNQEPIYFIILHLIGSDAEMRIRWNFRDKVNLFVTQETINEQIAKFEIEDCLLVMQSVARILLLFRTIVKSLKDLDVILGEIKLLMSHLITNAILSDYLLTEDTFLKELCEVKGIRRLNDLINELIVEIETIE